MTTAALRAALLAPENQGKTAPQLAEQIRQHQSLATGSAALLREYPEADQAERENWTLAHRYASEQIAAALGLEERPEPGAQTLATFILAQEQAALDSEDEEDEPACRFCGGSGLVPRFHDEDWFCFCPAGMQASEGSR